MKKKERKNLQPTTVLKKLRWVNETPSLISSSIPIDDLFSSLIHFVDSEIMACNDDKLMNIDDHKARVVIIFLFFGIFKLEAIKIVLKEKISPCEPPEHDACVVHRLWTGQISQTIQSIKIISKQESDDDNYDKRHV